MDFEKIIDFATQQEASDLHLIANLPPFLRLAKKLIPIEGTMTVKEEEITQLITKLLTPKQQEQLKNNRQVDFLAFSATGTRLRGNAFYQENKVSLVFRIIPRKIRELTEIGFPQFLYEKLINIRHGLILVVGPTGQGKTTTLAAIIQEIMRLKTEHIITIEEPIEYIINSEKGIVQQREVGRDVLDFTHGIEAALREDPDMIMVGEMRNLETVSSVLTLAETGHTVLSTLHTNDATQTISRIIDIFPTEKQEQIRSQLAATIKIIIAQRLIPRANGGLVLAFEILTSNYAIQNYIRQNKIFQIPNVIQTDSSGQMVQFEQSLAGLVIEEIVTKETAMEYSEDPDQLQAILLANGVK